jgi:hypothetical protein
MNEASEFSLLEIESAICELQKLGRDSRRRVALVWSDGLAVTAKEQCECIGARGIIPPAFYNG